MPAVESGLEASCTAYMPVVYKMPMVRIVGEIPTDVNSECTSLNGDTLEMA